MNRVTEILDVIREALEKHPEFGQLTPTLMDPEKMETKLSIGIVETVDGKTGLSLTVSVEDLYKDRYKNK